MQDDGKVAVVDAARWEGSTDGWRKEGRQQWWRKEGRQQWWMQEGGLLVSDTVLQNLPSPDLTQQKSLRSGFGG